MQLQARFILSAVVIWIAIAGTDGRPSKQSSPQLQPLQRETRENSGFYTAHQNAGISKQVYTTARREKSEASGLDVNSHAEDISGKRPEHRNEEELKFYGGAKNHYLVNHPVYGLVSSVRLSELKDKDMKEKDEDQENEDESEEEESETVEIQPPPKGASVAEAKPVGLAIAGEGGVAVSKPVATSVVGPGGLAIARPIATAIAGVRINEAILGGLGGEEASGSDKPQKPSSAKAPERSKHVAVGPHKSPDAKYGVFPLFHHGSATHPNVKAAQQYVYYPVAYY